MPQAILNSDRITINSKQDSIFLSSFQHIYIGAGNSCTIKTTRETVIDSSNVYLGEQAKERTEPLVLGEQLRVILESIVGIFENLKVTGCIAGLSGPVDPATIQKVTSLKNKLSSPEFWSEYHFIEENGQKATGQEQET